MTEISQGIWKRVSELFDRAVDVPVADRRTWLDRACGNDRELRAGLERLLKANDRPTGVLDESPVDRAPILSQSSSDQQEPLEIRSLVGGHVGRYRVLREAGRGAMGVVYQAYDPRLGRFVALKVLTRLRRADNELSARLVAEARAAASLDHPNICTVYDVGETDDGDGYIAMAYYAGQTLARRLELGPLPVFEAVRIAILVLRGLDVAHRYGIVHRDIKPSNVLLTSTNEVKVVDFGIAVIRRREPLEDRATRPGTPAYMAPEQTRGEAVDHRADLWAVGVMLYEMAEGQRPFAGETVRALFEHVRTADPLSRSSRAGSLSLDSVLGTALAKHANERFRDAGAFLAALATLGAPSSFQDRAAGKLPAPITSFLGRETEVADLCRRLQDARLITLTGPGGAGKTRLSIEVARRVEEHFPDGVVFVPLGAVRDAGRVPHLIARCVGLGEATTDYPVDAVVALLSRSQCLLVLDNFEQVVDAAPLLADILSACPLLRIIVTSRTALRLHGEHVWTVPPLSIPSLDASLDTLGASPAVRLFVARATATHPRFELTAHNRRDVAALCRALDGLPLALELAAAQVHLLPPEAMRVRLQQALDLPRSGPRDAPDRHRTLRQAVTWSYNLLPDDAQRLFTRLGVFTGGTRLSAAERVARVGPRRVDDVLGALTVLVDHSLVRQEEAGREPRFVMLQTIQSYARHRFERIDSSERDAVRQAHLVAAVELAEEAEPQLTTGAQTQWLDRLEAERGNLQAAVDWAVESNHGEEALRIAAATWRLWLVRGPLAEGRQLLDRVLARFRGDEFPVPTARTLAGVGTLAHNQGDNYQARDRLRESLSLWRIVRDRRGVASALTDLAWVYCELSELEPAQSLSTEALSLHRSLGERRGVARALNNLGWIANYRADYATARACLEEGLAIRRDIGDQRGIAYVLSSLAWAEEYHGDLQRAEELGDEGRDALNAINDPVLSAFNRLISAMVCRRRGQLAAAQSRLDALGPLAERSGNTSLAAWTATERGLVALAAGRLENAERNIEAGLAAWQAICCPWGVAMALIPHAELLAARNEPGGEGLIDEAAAIYARVRDPRGLADAWEALGRIVASRDRRAAQELSERAARLRADWGLPSKTVGGRP